MRTPSIFLALVALPTLFLSALARPKALYTPTFSAARRTDVLSSRQYHAPRQLLDLCAEVNTNQLVDEILGSSSLLNINLAALVNSIVGLKLCLCLSALPVEIEANADLSLLSGLLPPGELESLLGGLISSSPNAEQCKYPPNSSPVCSSSDPCGFTCNSPYVKVNNQCVCPAGYVACNGQCAKSCASSYPKP